MNKSGTRLRNLTNTCTTINKYTITVITISGDYAIKMAPFLLVTKSSPPSGGLRKKNWNLH